MATECARETHREGKKRSAIRRGTKFNSLCFPLFFWHSINCWPVEVVGVGWSFFGPKHPLGQCHCQPQCILSESPRERECQNGIDDL